MNNCFVSVSILNGIFLDILLTSSLLEKTFKKYGIIGEKDYSKGNFNFVENCFKSDWLDWINVMNTYKYFPELNEYMKQKIKDENIQFDQLFYKIDNKVLKEKKYVTDLTLIECDNILIIAQNKVDQKVRVTIHYYED